MSATALLSHPLARPGDLGRTLPDSPHAVSVAMPTWADVVGYEEHAPAVMAKLKSGYPRFVIHPCVEQLARRFEPAGYLLPFPSPRTAEQAAGHVRRASGQRAVVRERAGAWGVETTAEGGPALKAFWQHTGMIISSRQAEFLLHGGAAPDSGAAPRAELRAQLAALYDCEAGDVFLAPTGMAAHYLALQALNLRAPGRPTVQLGFPYVDTLKLQQKLGCGVQFLHNLHDMAADLRAGLCQQPAAGAFCELPGNPLLGCADLRAISPILREAGVPLVADDVVATPLNIDLRPYADLIATSLTKFIAGTGDVMGGAVICNPASPWHDELKRLLVRVHEELLWPGDATVLAREIGSFPERMRRHNANGLAIAERLRQHPAVERIWYPKWEFSEAYEAVRRPTGGWGALVTFLPKEAGRRSPAVYDRLAVCKGPSLGTRFSLACPFTILAHYCELEWAESCGVSRYLIRLSVGLEDPDELWGRIEAALAPAVD